MPAAVIARAIDECGGGLAAAAAALGVSRWTLQDRVRADAELAPFRRGRGKPDGA